MECPRCHWVNHDGRRFCGDCGTALASGHGDPERRQLTVMFCDLVGSTALSRELDPEDLRHVILRYQESTRRVVERYDGYIARYMGDGVLAYFGYPGAHEDDVVRAVHAGLAVVAAQRKAEGASEGTAAPPRVRVGIATGLVVVGDMIGKGGSEEAAAVGESINLAARMQALAEPDSVLVSQRTRQLADGHFSFADHGSHALKGFDQPVHAWQALHAAAADSRFDAVRLRGMTPFVGRVREMDVVTSHWRRAVDGAGQMVLVVGEAGIGKSRVVDTLSQRIAGDAHVLVRCQCSPYHSNSALHPFIQRLERDAGFASGDTVTQKFDKLQTWLARFRHDAETASLLAGLLSLASDARYRPLPLTSQQQKTRTIAALVERLVGLAADVPLLVIVEDVHWIDPTSIELLDLFARRIRGHRIAVFLTSRTVPNAAWVALDHAGSVVLERLGLDEASMMARSVAATCTLPDAAIAKIVAKTDGVPLFIEEFTKALGAEGAAGPDATPGRMLEPQIPLTLQDSLMARLDRLGPAKQVAQLASVLGREFSRDLLSRLSLVDARELDDALGRLISSAVLFGRGPAPWAAYAFKHVLVQEAAYGSLLRSRRQELHGRVGTLLETAYAERAATEPELVAHHFAQAGQPMRAAGYGAAAAKRALDRSANLEALSHAASALALLEGVSPGSEKDRLELILTVIQGTANRAVHGFASARVEQSFARALRLCETLGDTLRVVDVRRGLFSFYYARGAHDLAQRQGDQVVALADRTGDVGTRMLGCWMQGVLGFWRGDFQGARRDLEHAVSLYRPDPHVAATTLALQIDPGVNAWSHLTWVLWILGQPDTAIESGAKAVATARALNQPLAVAMSLFFSCATFACCGRQRALSAPLDELLAVTAEHKLGYLGSCARVLKGQQLIAMDRCEEGLAQVHVALAEFEAQEAELGLPWSLSILAAGHAALGRFETGLGVIARAFEAIERTGERQWASEVWRLKGELLQGQSPANAEEAAGCFRRAMAVARTQAARSLELRAAMSLARLLKAQGHVALARETLNEARRPLTEGLDSSDIRDADQFLAGLARAPRRNDAPRPTP